MIDFGSIYFACYIIVATVSWICVLLYALNTAHDTDFVEWAGDCVVGLLLTFIWPIAIPFVLISVILFGIWKFLRIWHRGTSK